MKKLSLLLVIATALTSCNKKKCYNCETFSTHNGNTVPYYPNHTQVCDKTKSEIKDYESQNSKTTITNTDTVYLTVACH